MQVLVDASVWIAYFRGDATPRTDLLHELLGHAPLVTADLVLAEVLRGFTDDADLEKAQKALGVFPWYVIGGKELSLASAGFARVLAAKGVPVPPLAQRLIATWCIQKNIALLHADPAYESFERALGLKVPDPGF
ncbi:MAG TPA: PIN domain-containing protein [Thermoanaerobaculia bacterium]|nr:PIN domain-containing protein [Thermoanaerobaculia bacterium]